MIPLQILFHLLYPAISEQDFFLIIQQIKHGNGLEIVQFFECDALLFVVSVYPGRRNLLPVVFQRPDRCRGKGQDFQAALIDKLRQERRSRNLFLHLFAGRTIGVVEKTAGDTSP